MPDPLNVQLRGLIRFSYLSENGFALTQQRRSRVRAVLFDRLRLERRFALFEALTLPSLRAQTDRDFKIAVLTSQDLPEWAMQKLQDLLATVPQATLVTMPPRAHYYAIKKAFNLLPLDDGATHQVTFRLDDDDAIHRETVARLRGMAQAMLPHRDAARALILGFNRGFYFEPDSDGPVLSEQYERTPLGVGLGLLNPVGSPENIFRRNHRHLAQYYDIYMEVGAPMFVRAVHRDNDSAANPTGRQGRMGKAQIEATLVRDFGLQLDQVRALSALSA